MEYNIIDDLPEDYTCQICMKLLNEPQLTDCCGQHFCRKCLDRWFQEQGKKQCPHCRRENFIHILNKPLKRKIKERKVYCSNREKGCGVKLKWDELGRHLSTDNPNGCGYVEIECPNKCCQSVLRKDMTHHLTNTCQQRTVKCRYCKQAGAYSYITNTTFGGHLQQCREYPTKCLKNCGTEGIKRKNLLKHQNVCPLQPVECPYKEVGCENQVLRKDLNDHLQSNTQQHLSKLMLSHTMLLKELNELKTLRSTVASVADQLEQIQVKVKDAEVADSLQKISKSLSGITLQLTKEGDQLKFQIPCGSFDWISPVFRVQGRKLYLAVNPRSTDSPTTMHAPVNQIDASMSLILLAGNLNGRYEVKTDMKCEQRTEKPLSLLHLSATNNCTKLCDKCHQKITYSPHSVPIPGEKIDHMRLPTGFDSGCYETCIVTLTLKVHHCPPSVQIPSQQLSTSSSPLKQSTSQQLCGIHVRTFSKHKQ